MPIMEISIVPVGTNTSSVSKYVSDVLKALDNKKEIKCQLTAMRTIIEADSIKVLLTLADRMHNSVINKDVNRVVTTIKIDDRKDKKLDKCLASYLQSSLVNPSILFMKNQIHVSSPKKLRPLLNINITCRIGLGTQK